MDAQSVRLASVGSSRAAAQGPQRLAWRAQSAVCSETRAGKSDLPGPDPTKRSSRQVGAATTGSSWVVASHTRRRTRHGRGAPCDGGAAPAGGRFGLTSISGLQPCMDTTPHERPLPSHISASLLVSGLSRPFPIGPSPLAAWAGCRRTPPAGSARRRNDNCGSRRTRGGSHFALERGSARCGARRPQMSGKGGRLLSRRSPAKSSPRCRCRAFCVLEQRESGLAVVVQHQATKSAQVASLTKLTCALTAVRAGVLLPGLLDEDLQVSVEVGVREPS